MKIIGELFLLLAMLFGCPAPKVASQKWIEIDLLIANYPQCVDSTLSVESGAGWWTLQSTGDVVKVMWHFSSKRRFNDNIGLTGDIYMIIKTDGTQITNRSELSQYRARLITTATLKDFKHGDVQQSRCAWVEKLVKL